MPWWIARWNCSLIVVSLANCHLLFDLSCPWEMISNGWWTCVGHTLKLTTYPLEIGYLAEEWIRWIWNLTDKPSVLVANWNLPSMLVTHQNLLWYNNKLYLRDERMYIHIVVCDYRELVRELSAQMTPLSSKSRVHRVKGTGIANFPRALFLARARLIKFLWIIQFGVMTR